MTVQSVSKPDTPPVEAPITGETFFKMGNLGPAELVKGAIKKMTPPGYEYSIIENNIGSLLRNFVREQNLGFVMSGETGIFTNRNPDTIRGMDVAFRSHERMAQVKSKSYLDVAPELVVEIMSPSDRWSETNDKLAEYFAIGVKLVWIVNPSRKEVHIYRALTEIEIPKAGETLTGGQVLPGLSIPVADLFTLS
jgi:Uma2 family endonuclease